MFEFTFAVEGRHVTIRFNSQQYGLTLEWQWVRPRWRWHRRYHWWDRHAHTWSLYTPLSVGEIRWWK